MLPDTPKYQNWRKQMAKNLRQKGITDENVLRVMEKVPRHVFVGETALDHILYDVNQALPIDCGQTISKPYTVAWQTELLELGHLDTVLEVGTGSGYQTAILCELGARVFTVERHQTLFRKTKELLAQMRYSAKCYLGDCFNGLVEMKGFQFDRIIVTCGAPQVPQGLLDMLKVGGIMVIPVGVEQQRMLKIYKDGPEPGQCRAYDYGDAYFVPMLQGRSITQKNLC